MNVIQIHIKMIRRNTWSDYFATLRFCFAFFDRKTAIRLPIYVTPLVRYEKPKDKNRIVLNTSGKQTQPAQLLIGYLDRQYSWDRPSLINILGQLRLHGEGTRYFAPGVSLYIKENAFLDIGMKFTSSHNLRLFVHKHITIGNDNMWSFDCVVMDSDTHQIFDNNSVLTNAPKEVIFGDHIWLGARNIILKGTKIPDGCVIGASNVLRKGFEEVSSIYSGGKIIRSNINWCRPIE